MGNYEVDYAEAHVFKLNHDFTQATMLKKLDQKIPIKIRSLETKNFLVLLDFDMKLLNLYDSKEFEFKGKINTGFETIWKIRATHDGCQIVCQGPYDKNIKFFNVD